MPRLSKRDAPFGPPNPVPAQIWPKSDDLSTNCSNERARFPWGAARFPAKNLFKSEDLNAWLFRGGMVKVVRMLQATCAALAMSCTSMPMISTGVRDPHFWEPLAGVF